MGSNLYELKKKIFFGDHSDEEWMQIKQEVERRMEVATADERNDFLSSGAGNLLMQIIEYMD